MQEKLSHDELVNKKRVVTNTALQAIGIAVNLVTGLCITGMLARYLGTRGFGELSLAITYFSFAGIAANLGYTSILVRELAKNETWEPDRVNSLLSSALVLQALSTTIAVACLAVVLWAKEYPVALKIQILLMGVVHFAALLNSFESVFRAKLRMEYAAFSAIIYRICHLVLITLAVYFHASLTTVIITYIGANLVYSLFLFLWARKFIVFRFIVDMPCIRFLLRETLPMGISTALWIIYYRFNILILEHMKGVEAVAIYNASFRFVDYAYMLSSLMMVSIYPLMAGRFPNNIEGLNRIYQKAIDYLAIIGGTLSIGLIITAPLLIRTIFSEQYREAIVVLQILGMAPFLMFLNNCFGNMLLVLGLQKMPLSLLRVFGVAINLVLNMALIPRYSFYGAALSMAVTDAVLLAIIPLIVRSRLKVLPSFRNMILAFVVLLVTLGLTLSGQPWYIAIPAPALLWTGSVIVFFRYNAIELRNAFFLKLSD